MKILLKSITLAIVFVIIIGFFLCIYILQAPPVEQSRVSKIQMHTRTGLRGNPRLDSKPIAYTKDVYRFSCNPKYISNLNSGNLSTKLLFSADLAHRARLKAKRLDEELKTATDWAKMFSGLTENVRFDSHSHVLEVLLSGEEWFLTDSAGAGYKIVRTQNRVDVYLPNLKEIFETNNVRLSKNTQTSIQKEGRQWLIKDIDYIQTYVIKLGRGKLNVYQQSKYEILELLFDIELASKPALAASLIRIGSESTPNVPVDLYEIFANQKIALTRKAKFSVIEPRTNWLITDSPQKYRIEKNNGKLMGYLELDSKWLRIRVDDSIQGWVQRERGTVFPPPLIQLSSRQQAKQRLLLLVEKWKEKN